LRLDDAAFWRLTPRQFAALSARLYAAERRADSRAALVASVIANVNRDTKRKPQPFTVADFLPPTPEAQRKAKAKKKQAQSIEQQAALLQALTAAWGRKV
jgi:hypothetical protein